MVLRGARFYIGPRGSGASRGIPEPENLLYRPGEEVCKHAVRADNRHGVAGYIMADGERTLRPGTLIAASKIVRCNTLAIFNTAEGVYNE